MRKEKAPKPRVAFINPTVFPFKNSTAISNFTPQRVLGKVGLDVRVYARASRVQGTGAADYVSLYRSLFRRGIQLPTGKVSDFLFNQLDMFLFALFCLKNVRRENAEWVVVEHLWDPGNPVLILIMSLVRPTFVWWLGGSLRLTYRVRKSLYWFVLIAYKVALKRAVVLTEDEPEQIDNVTRLLGIPRSRMETLGVDPFDDSVFYPIPEIGRQTDKFILLCVGRIPDRKHVSEYKDYDKDPFTFLEIFSNICKERDDVYLWFAGTGPGMTQLRETVESKGLQDRVRFLGHLPPKTLSDYYRRATLTVIAGGVYSLFDASVALRESLSCGVPVVAFKRSALVGDEYCGGFLIPYDVEDGSRELLSRLNRAYLEKKAKETQEALSFGTCAPEIWAAAAKRILLRNVLK